MSQKNVRRIKILVSNVPVYMSCLKLVNHSSLYSEIEEGQLGFDSKSRKLKAYVNKLINMYVKCVSLVNARRVFDDITERDVISWNIIVAGNIRFGYPYEALILYHQMQRANVQPNHFTFSSIFPVCARLRASEEGMEIYQSIMERGILSNVVKNALADMYAKCVRIHEARELFVKTPQKNVVLRTAMIVGYAQNGDLGEALRLFKEMPQRDTVSWNAMIAGYEANWEWHQTPHPLATFSQPMAEREDIHKMRLLRKALKTYKQMQLAGVNPVSTTFMSILPACAKLFSRLFPCSPPVNDPPASTVRATANGPSWALVVVGGPCPDSNQKSGRVPSSHRRVGRGFIPVSCVVYVNVNKESEQEIENSVKVFTEHSAICRFKGIWPSLSELHK
ncbi:pentatricopeptide repeat-containing protein At2g13600-like [Cryptomeria japonica]|uniref:pentatricopeptide repeat-containing protein At2g13600-like n=1 Tax=Cryptomeria japonica TaxID=3369 RepID=UPI0027DA7528|nr:pentatricopeptide repeat-containing protein At2g13600-like [Cryptomeria japonica]